MTGTGVRARSRFDYLNNPIPAETQRDKTEYGMAVGKTVYRRECTYDCEEFAHLRFLLLERQRFFDTRFGLREFFARHANRIERVNAVRALQYVVVCRPRKRRGGFEQRRYVRLQCLFPRHFIAPVKRAIRGPVVS